MYTEFTQESNSERILEIDLHLPKLYDQVKCIAFETQCQQVSADRTSSLSRHSKNFRQWLSVQVVEAEMVRSNGTRQSDGSAGK